MQHLRRDKLRTVRRREGRYLLRSNLRHEDPATLWQYYIRLTEIEQAFKELKHDLAIRPIYHQTDKHIEAHIFIAFIAWPGGRGQLPTRGSHGSGRAPFGHPAPQIMVSLLNGTHCARRAQGGGDRC